MGTIFSRREVDAVRLIGLIVLLCATLYHMPLRLELRGEIGMPQRVWAAVRVKIGNVQIMPERTVLIGRFPKDTRRTKPPKGAPFQIAKALWKRRTTRLRARLALCTGDAAATAVACGALCALEGLSGRAHIEAQAQYGEQAFCAGEGMAQAKIGHIILALIGYLYEKRRT